MPQRLSEVRLFNLDMIVVVDMIIYNWSSRALIVKALFRDGKYYEVNLGIPQARFEALLGDRKKMFEFVNALATVLSCATGQTFDSVGSHNHRERIWFFKYGA